MAGQQGHNSAVDEVGLGLVAAGVISQLFSSATTPQADTRTWDNLPHYLSFASLSLPAGDHPATVAFYDSAGHILPNLTKHLTIHVPQDGATRVVFVSDQSSTPQTL